MRDNVLLLASRGACFERGGIWRIPLTFGCVTMSHEGGTLLAVLSKGIQWSIDKDHKVKENQMTIPIDLVIYKMK